MFSKNYIIQGIAEMLQVEKIFDFVWNFKNVNIIISKTIFLDFQMDLNLRKL